MGWKHDALVQGEINAMSEERLAELHQAGKVMAALFGLPQQDIVRVLEAASYQVHNMCVPPTFKGGRFAHEAAVNVAGDNLYGTTPDYEPDVPCLKGDWEVTYKNP